MPAFGLFPDTDDDKQFPSVIGLAKMTKATIGRGLVGVVRVGGLELVVATCWAEHGYGSWAEPGSSAAATVTASVAAAPLLGRPCR